ncbi:unnamed protein product [Penicillium camemberti]|uniref:Str. FM013 n=1 Tax=Penicillium camemberti (strain FM 013) TaxID=1429867 RepID=A0A0G4PXL0_PENC3|nr:unnamed protein product [Penicillium camemberti]
MSTDEWAPDNKDALQAPGQQGLPKLSLLVPRPLGCVNSMKSSLSAGNLVMRGNASCKTHYKELNRGKR